MLELDVVDVVGRVRVFVDFVEVERLTLVRELDERDELVVLERLTLVLSRDELVVLERLTLGFAREALEFDVVLLYFGTELLLVLEENDRLDDVFERL